MVGTARIQSFLSWQVGVINLDRSDEMSDDICEEFSISMQSKVMVQSLHWRQYLAGSGGLTS